jgi:hypothetical protein
MFAFFRRRQKLVVIVMVVLMVSFLAGYKGLDMLTSRGVTKDEVGRFADGSKLRSADMQIAQNDLRLIGMTGIGREFLTGLELGNQKRTDPAFAVLAYALLTHESEPYGPVLDSQIDGMLGYMGLKGDAYTELLVMLRTEGISEVLFRDMLSRLVRNREAFGVGTAISPPSLPELKHLYNTMEERVVLNYLTLPAEDFIAQARPADAFTDDEITAQFEAHRDVIAGFFSETNPYGFGYRVPASLDVEYLLVGFGPLYSVLAPSDNEIYAFYDENIDKMVREVPTGDVDAMGEPILMTETVSRGEARPMILEAMRLDTIRARADEMLTQADQFVADSRKPEAAPIEGNVYDAAVASMTRSADNVLAIELVDIEVANETVLDAMKFLSMKAKIKGISFPMVDAAGEPIALDKTVSVRKGTMTLGDALGSIASQVGMTDLEWVQCSTLVGADAVLFTGGEEGTFPLRAGKTGLMDKPTLATDPLLQQVGGVDMATRRPYSLADLAFVPAFFPTEEELEDIASYETRLAEELVEHYYPVLAIPVEPYGALMWRVAQVERSTVPELADAKDAVIADLQMLEGMGLAQTQAEALLAATRDMDFSMMAERNGYETTLTPAMARMTPNPYNGQVGWTNVPGLTLPTFASREAFFEAVFALAQPDMVEQMGGERSAKIGVVEVPSERAVCLVNVISHQRPSDLAFAQQGGLQMRIAVREARQMQTLGIWMDYDEIAERTGFVLSERDESSEEE